MELFKISLLVVAILLMGFFVFSAFNYTNSFQEPANNYCINKDFNSGYVSRGGLVICIREDCVGEICKKDLFIIDVISKVDFEVNK